MVMTKTMQINKISRRTKYRAKVPPEDLYGHYSNRLFELVTQARSGLGCHGPLVPWICETSRPGGRDRRREDGRRGTTHVPRLAGDRRRRHRPKSCPKGRTSVACPTRRVRHRRTGRPGPGRSSVSRGDRLSRRKCASTLK